MKKKYYAFSLLLAGLIAGSLVSCNNDEESVIVDGDVTGVLVSGPYSVEIGKSITLIASVQGSSDNRVTWEVSDESIATITSEGVLTGLKEGQVEVKAISVKDPNFYGTWNVQVNGVQASEIEIVIDTSNPDIYVEDGIYYIPGGVEFYISYELKNGSKIPDSVSYTFSFVSQDETPTSADCTIETVVGSSGKYDSAKIKFNRAFEGGLITASASYLSSVSADMKSTIYVNSYDKNGENTTKVLDIIDKISAKEQTNLLSATQQVTQNDTLTKTSFESYLDGTYSTKETYNDDSLTSKEYAYATLDEKENIFYYFSYNEDKTIDEIYANESYALESLADYKAKVAVGHLVVDGVPTYGFANLLKAIFTNELYQGETSFGDFTTNSNATYTFDTNLVNITSHFVDDFDIEMEVNFTLNYNENYEISSYSYEVSTKEYNEDELTVKYQEIGKDFVYGDKTLDNVHKVSLNDYYITSFEAKYIENYAELTLGNGADNSRYEYISFEEDGDNGRDSYIASYDHTIPLKITNFAPNTASLLIDVAKITATNSVAGTRSISIFEDGSALLNAPKDEDGYFIVSQDVVTFETRGGGVDEVVINWTKPELIGLNFDCPRNQDVNVTHEFPSIRPYQETPYFWLNADPDDSIYSFDMKVVSGNSEGINLKRYESDRSIPSGAYTVQSLLPGTYEFYFYVEGYETIKTENFTLTVLDPISAKTYRENLVGNTYYYKTETMKYSLYFENDHNIVLTTPVLSSGSASQTTSVNISYTISDGRVSITPDVIDGEAQVNQIFDSDISYFESAYATDLRISEDFSSVSISLRLRADAENDQYNYNYYYCTFTLPADLSDLTNKSFASEALLNGKATMSRLVITFNENNQGIMVLTEISTGNVLANLTFDYENDATLKVITLKNVVINNSTVDGLVYLNSEMKDENTLLVKFECPTNFGYSLSTIYTFDLTSPL